MREGMAGWLAGLIVRRWRWVLVAAVMASVLSFQIVRGISFEESILDLFPKRSQVARDSSLFMKHFSMEDSLFVLLECKDPNRLLEFAESLASRLRNEPLLKAIQYRSDFRGKEGNPYRFLFGILDEREFNEVLERLSRPGMERSVASLKALLLAPSLPVDRKLLTMDPLGLLRLLADHLSGQGLPVDLASGYYLSKDRTALLMILRPTRSSYEISFNKRLIESLKEIEREVRNGGGQGPAVEMSYTGSYVYALTFAQWLQSDFMVLSIISLGGVLALFFLFFGRILVLPLILLPLAASMFWTLALAGLFLGYLNVISIAFSSIVPGLGINIAIHFYARFREEVDSRGIRLALEETFSHTGRPTLTAVTTTAIVFLVFAFSNFKGIAELGVLCGLGMLINLAAMLLVFPCLLVGAIQCGLLRPARREGGWGTGLEGSLQRFYLRNGKKVLVGGLLMVLVMIWPAKDVRFEQSIQGLVPKDFPPALVSQRIQEFFGKGGQRLVVLVRDHELERALQKNDALKKELDRMVADGTIRAFDSLSSFCPSAETQRRNLLRVHDLDRDRVLKDLREVLVDQGFRLEPFSQFFLNFMESGQEVFSIDKGLPEGLEVLVGNYLRRDGEDHLVATYLYCADTSDFMKAYHRLSSGEGSWRDRAIITGFPLVEREFARIVRHDFGMLTVISILGVLGILMLHFRGWREILVILVPLFGSAVTFLALMHILDIPVNLFNLIVIPLMFGNGVDDHVYILQRYLDLRERDSIGKAVFRSGKAVVLDSLTTMVGFGALMASHFGGLVLLGITAMMGIGLNLLAALVVMPSLLPYLHRPSIRSDLDTPGELSY